MDPSQNEINEAETVLNEDDFPTYQEEIEAEDSYEELEDDDEKSDSLNGMSASDKKKHQIEYLQLLKEIEGQNQIVEQLKDQLYTARDNPCLTKCGLRMVKKLRSCIENENLKLQFMVQKAIMMQNEVPGRCWEEVPIVTTTIEDDVFPQIGNSNVMASLGLAPREANTIHSCKKSFKKKQICPADYYEDDNMDIETCQLFEEMAKKDRLIKRLNNKLKTLQKDVNCHLQQNQQQNLSKRTFVGDNITYMQSTVEKLKEDLKNLCKEKQAQSIPKKKELRLKKSNEIQKLKENYTQLLFCYAKKDAELKELKGRVKGHFGSDTVKADYVDQAELKLLREKIDDMQDEENEYNCIIKEQAEQLEEYRKKYMDAQQKVEEQKSMLVKIDMNNKRIEGQIEAEIKRIKATFKEQLNELSQYPKLLENEQMKVISLSKERDDLEDQLRLICKELKSTKENMSFKVDKPDCSQLLAKCENELVLLQSEVEKILKEKEIVSEELLKTKLDLDTMRGESAKIITNTKERFEITKTSLNFRIDILEKELAQCRANASLSITDREAVIKEMQTQLSTLSYSFDSAQKQIKTLKNHITFLSNDQCIPIKC